MIALPNMKESRSPRRAGGAANRDSHTAQANRDADCLLASAAVRPTAFRPGSRALFIPDKLVCFVLVLLVMYSWPKPVVAGDYQLFAPTNLVAWCIVPFDAKKRGPEERAAMLEHLGIPKLAYDYRAEHIPTFDEEMEALRRHDIELTAWWFPTALNPEARLILDVLKRHGLQTQLWITGGGNPTSGPEEQAARIRAEADRLRPLAEAAQEIGCTVALYNHGGWFGEPENQIAIVERLREDGISNVGLVYNQHHGHGHLDRFAELMSRMKPHLLTLNLNGMSRGADQRGQKIMPLGQGDLDLTLLRIIQNSGWTGPIGILNHTDEDAEARLRDNLDGLAWLRNQMRGEPAGPKPTPRSWSPPPATIDEPANQGRSSASLSEPFGRALRGGLVVEGNPRFRKFPLTVECLARLDSRTGFNILVASDPKASAHHWELYSYTGSGVFSLFMPGRGGEYKSSADIADGRWHALAAILEEDRARLFVDGRLVLDAPVPPLRGNPAPGGLAFGRLVEGGIGCDGLVDEVRLSNTARVIAKHPPQPLRQDEATLGLWRFDELSDQSSSRPPADPWAVEDAAARAVLPKFKTIPATPFAELTPASNWPEPDAMRKWHRSLGDATSNRYSALDQIDRSNVARLKRAWTYRSGDGAGNIQCNPIVVDGVMFAPTVGHHIVAVDAASGRELWRFQPELPRGSLRLEDLPARRGLLHWPGREDAPARLIFAAGNWIYALHPGTGQPVLDFGESGRAHLPAGGTAVGAVYRDVLVVPGYARDVFGYDIATGRPLWTFHTIPQPGEFGHETWSDPERASGANCWGGMALDESRGIAYVATGSPKPNFIGANHHGENLFANCVIALDALTGERLWHFQEIRHDIWDLDIPAPPNLVTITREGKRVDAVAQVTKLGHTLLLDRVSGRPIFPFRLRRAPTSTLPGEWTAPYQPDPEWPEPFARQIFCPDQITTRTEEAREHVLARVSFANHGWFEPFTEGKPTVLYGIHGGAEWTGAAVDPATDYLYVSANELPWAVTVMRQDPEPPRDPHHPTRGETVYQLYCASCHGADRIGVGVAPPLRGLRHRMADEEVVALMKEGRNLMPAAPPMSDEDREALLDFLFVRDVAGAEIPAELPTRPSYIHSGYPKLLDHEGYPGIQPPWGTLNCIDLNTGRLRWKVPLGEYEELSAAGVPKTGTENFGGAIVTAGGLVFCAGTRDEKIRAFDAETGRELWEHDLPWGGYAPPATYQVDGQQYLVIAATGGGKLGGPTGDAYVAFALPAANQ